MANNMLVDLLKLLESCGGEVESRIRIQKEVFLLSLKYSSYFGARRFEYHHYGPYSRELSDTLQLAVLAGYVDEVDETPEDRSFTKYRYLLTRSGGDAVSDTEVSPEFTSDAKRLQAENWRTLELAATVKYLELREKLNVEEAFSKALKLKPATIGYEKQARNLLGNWCTRF